MRKIPFYKRVIKLRKAKKNTVRTRFSFKLKAGNAPRIQNSCFKKQQHVFPQLSLAPKKNRRRWQAVGAEKKNFLHISKANWQRRRGGGSGGGESKPGTLSLSPPRLKFEIPLSKLSHCLPKALSRSTSNENRRRFFAYCFAPKIPKFPTTAGGRNKLSKGTSQRKGGINNSSPPPGKACVVAGRYLIALLLSQFPIGSKVVCMKCTWGGGGG